MFGDAMKALTSKDIALAQDVIGRDLEVDKLNFIIIRQFHSLITGKTSDEATGLGLVDCNYYSFVAAQIERIADHTIKIARTIVAVPKTAMKHSSDKVFEQKINKLFLH